MIKAKQFERKGELVSKKAFAEHIKLYEKYVDKYNETCELIEQADKEAADKVFSEIRALKRENAYCLASVIIHELFFKNCGQGGEAPAEFVECIEKHFESFKKWKEDFVATANSSRDWAMLCYSQRNDKLLNLSFDDYSQSVLNIVPIIVIDTKEHGYFADYPNDLEKYVERFVENTDWDVILNRLKILEVKQ